MKMMFRVWLAGIAFLTGNVAMAQNPDVSNAEMLKDLEAKAVQIIIGKTADEIRKALDATPFADAHVIESEYGIDSMPPADQVAWQEAVNMKPGDLHVIFSRPKKSVFEPFTPRVSIIVGMQDGVAVSIERVRTYPK